MMIPPLGLLDADLREPTPKPAPPSRVTGRTIIPRKAARVRRRNKYELTNSPPASKRERIEAARRKAVEKARRSAARSQAARGAAA